MCRFVIVRVGESRTLIASAEAEGEAREKASDLAADEPETSFEVYQIIGTARTEPRVVWKGAGL